MTIPACPLPPRCWICHDPATHGAAEAPLGDGAELCDDCFAWESLK